MVGLCPDTWWRYHYSRLITRLQWLQSSHQDPTCWYAIIRYFLQYPQSSPSLQTLHILNFFWSIFDKYPPFRAHVYCDILKVWTFFKRRKWLFDVYQFVPPVTSHFRNKQFFRLTNLHHRPYNWSGASHPVSLKCEDAINFCINSGECPGRIVEEISGR